MAEKKNVEKRTGNGEVRLKGMSYSFTVIMSILGTLMCINQIFDLHAFGITLIGNAYYYLILAAYLSVAFLIFPGSGKSKHIVMWYDWCLFFVCIIDTVYLASNANNILTKGWEYSAPFLPTLAGVLLWLLALEAVRRTGGLPLFVICLIFSFYPLYAGHMPGFLWGHSFPLLQLVTAHSMGAESIIGIPVRVVGNMLIGFMLFGVALVSSGGGKFFMDFAFSLFGSKRGGAAKVCVVSSAFMASLSGSIISNVATVGPVTIPVMKKTGYSSKWAAAIEGCASMGGTVTPPIMGAAGFLIASFLNVPYSQVMLAAVFPALLYYLILLLQVDIQATTNEIRGLPQDELPNLFDTLKSGWFYFGTVILLVFFLIYIRTEAWAPYYAIIFLFICAMIRKETRYTWKKFTEFAVDAARLLGQITAILAGVGLIVGSLSVTGVANSFARELVLFAHGNWILLLVLGAFVSFILGMGMTVTACYLFLAVVLVPALVKIGLDPMACHLFVLYWGTLSYITPPVALGIIAAATIAEAPPMRSGFLAMRLGIGSFIMPFLFVLNPSMILIGPWGEILLSTSTAILGSVLLANALGGYLYFGGRLPVLLRIATFMSGFCLLYPRWQADVIGLLLLVVVYMVVWLMNKPQFYQKQPTSMVV